MSWPGFCFRFIAVACLAALLATSRAGAAPGDILFSDTFAAGGGCAALGPNWTTSNGNLGGLGTLTSNSGGCSLFTRGGAVTNTSRVIDLSLKSSVDFSAWVRRGSDAFSEYPVGGENVVLEYLDTTGAWVAIQTFTGGGAAGIACLNMLL